jgi:hypothetical protein
MRIALAIRLGNGAPSFRSLSSPQMAKRGKLRWFEEWASRIRRISNHSRLHERCVTCDGRVCRRRERKDESPRSKTVTATQPHARGVSR